MYCDFPVVSRCCFCMPLRRGILTIGYINIVFSLFMIGLYSYVVHYSEHSIALYRGYISVGAVPTALCIALNGLDLIFNVVLLYGAHRALILPVKVYYYYAITTFAASLILSIIDFAYINNALFLAAMLAEDIPLLLASKVLEIYLIILVRSLLRKLDTAGPHSYGNMLHQTVFEGTVDSNGIYNNDTSVPVDV